MTTGALVARVLVERRRVLLPLGIAAMVNLGVYALAVYPLSLKVASSERRAVTARAQLQAAEREEATTRAALSVPSRPTPICEASIATRCRPVSKARGA